ncbi:RNA-binding E3 ubiquitin-protein ligase MEX3C-like isoform X2 [Passer domesticus]|uniref:RNA-binding E3 ubiquitin-protein ligase MEX3C-like isoform X2 n=1 Tax=Passer domesticus TaxID=48849 RepID=UPI0030FE4BC4
MPSGAAEANEAAEPALLLLQQRLQGLGLPQPGAEEEEEEDDGGEAELREDEDEEAALLLPALLPRGLDVAGGRGMMAAMLPRTYGDAGAAGGEQAALPRRKSVNTTECVAVPSSEHVAEIVGRQAPGGLQ